jgi:CheY-like chemotaxis protein
MDRATAPPPEPSREERRHGAAAPEILVVDDNHDAADSLAMLLELNGYRVGVAYDGGQALAAAAAKPPAAIVLDLALPDITGYDVARRLRALPAFRETLIVALTGFGHDEARRLVREAGIDHHLVKPVDLPVLLGLLAQGTAPGFERSTP